MKTEVIELVSIDFEKMGTAMEKHVREKAIKANSTIMYMENGNLIEEDPKTLSKVTIKNSDPLYP